VTAIAGRTAVVTGAASGIGRATAVKLAERGAQVVLTDRDADGLAAVAAETGALHHAAFDISDHEAVTAFAAEVTQPVDIVMNVAGIATWGAVEELRHEDWQKIVEVNLMGPIHVIEAFVPAMVRGGRGGHLVNVSSAAGLLGLPWHAAYSASKFGLRGVHEVLRFDLRRHRIRCTLVCPGAVDTGLVQTLDIRGVDRDHPALQKMTKRFQGHAASPEKVAAIILKGVERNRELVFTSADIRAGFLLQRYAPPAYDALFHVINRGFHRVANKARTVS
jgi:NAD(P)-dependent dehydrogenase (short-subunit alcohol dehydrogenase family)